METQHVTHTVRACSHHGEEVPPPRPLWQNVVRRRLGKIVLSFCPKGRAPCANAHCALRALCDCARADLAAARRLESRVWLAIALCGALALLIAAWRSHSN